MRPSFSGAKKHRTRPHKAKKNKCVRSYEWLYNMTLSLTPSFGSALVRDGVMKYGRLIVWGVVQKLIIDSINRICEMSLVVMKQLSPVFLAACA